MGSKLAKVGSYACSNASRKFPEAPNSVSATVVRAVDVLAAIRSSRFDLPLTYEAGESELRVGDVVRVPIGAREHVGFVVSQPRSIEPDRPLRPVRAMPGVPRAFDEVGLALARFVADRYLCTLGEAVGAVVLSGAVPRMIDAFVIATAQPNRSRYPSVPQRLVSLIWEDLREGFVLEHLLRHPDARRAGDRNGLLRHLNTLVRSGELRRERRFVNAATQPYRVRVLYPAEGAIRGPKAQALISFVREQPGVPRADALLAGYSSALIARAIKAGALVERQVAPARQRSPAAPRAVPFEATPEQDRAISGIREALRGGTFAELLLHGVTGSGKTFVYIRAIEDVLRAGGRAIVLVPEISLTPQTARRFEEAFGDRVAVLHSALSERERYEAWQACAKDEVDVVVGARSAVFAPLHGVKLIVVDEAHESSYKQDTVPRYHAVAVARERMRIEGGTLVLGSATPSIESYEQAIRGEISLFELRSRASGLPLPAVDIVDMSHEFESGNRRIFSAQLTQALGERIERREKTVLFVNRRGSAGFLLCRACGFVPQCKRCSVSLTVHRAEGLLRCHYCDAQSAIPRSCPSCKSEAIREFGAGTERVSEEVARLYPDARVIRMDSDTTTRIGDHARLLAEFGEHGDVLVGTQMVAKGLDFPTVTLVGAIAADIGLHAPDFRAAERTFGLIAQVCGRSGRARPGRAIVQTYSPDHPAIALAARHDYHAFAAGELQERRLTNYPPACELIYIGVIGRNRPKTLAQAQRYAAILSQESGAEVLGPAPYPIARMNDEWRYRIALKGVSGNSMRAALRRLILPLARSEHATRLVVNVDP